MRDIDGKRIGSHRVSGRGEWNAWLRCSGTMLLVLLPFAGSASHAHASSASHGQRVDEARGNDEGWISLLSDTAAAKWTVKFTGHPLGEDPLRTFRFEDGMLRVVYDGVTPFGGSFGHIFHELPSDRYDLRVEYRFLETQAPGAPAWAYRNSGVMLHSQPPSTMGVDQPFPVSVEVQFLGGDGSGPRATAGFFTPGTNVHAVGGGEPQGRIASTAPTFVDDTWVTMHIEVRGPESVRVMIDGAVVNECRSAVLDENDAIAKRLMEEADVRPGAWSSRWISIQAESHAMDIRRLDVRPVVDGDAGADAASSSHVVMEFEADDGTPLEAKLTIPGEGEGPFPVVFYLHGAGPRTYDNPYRYTDDDGAPQIGRYLDFHAEHLAKRGVAFFRMSKRGCRAFDAAPWMTLDRETFSGATMDVLLEDYLAAIELLRNRPEIDASRIVLLSSSEGTRLAPQLAHESAEGIIGVAMVGYAGDNARETVIWQNTAGPWRNIQHLIPAARDGALSREEYDEYIGTKPEMAAMLPFDMFDVNGDDVLEEDDLVTLNAPRRDAIMSAIERGDDDFLWQYLLSLTSAYLDSWWDAEPNHALLMQLPSTLPLAIFHGALDGTCRVEAVHEAEEAFRAAERANLSVTIDPHGDHDLGWTHETALAGGPEAYHRVFDQIREWTQGPR